MERERDWMERGEREWERMRVESGEREWMARGEGELMRAQVRENGWVHW